MPRSLKVIPASPVNPASNLLTLRAYEVDSDNAYMDVSQSVEWQTVETGGRSILSQVNGLGVLRDRAVTETRILARKDGISGEFAISWLPFSNTRNVPYIVIRNPSLAVGATESLEADFTSSTLTFTSVGVGPLATWTSSDTTVITIDGRTARAVGVGVAEVTVSYQGVSDRLLVPVHPRRTRP